MHKQRCTGNRGGRRWTKSATKDDQPQSPFRTGLGRCGIVPSSCLSCLSRLTRRQFGEFLLQV